MEGILKSMTERRSIRKYAQRQIPDKALEEVLLAASYSPNAGNRQTTQIVICQDRAINEELGRINKAAFTGRVPIHNKVSDDQPSIADDPSLESAFYGAPAVITLFDPGNFLYTGPDCWIMANHIALAAYALGLGSCVMGRAEETFASPLGLKLKARWGIPEAFEAKAHVTLGYPEDGFPVPKARKYPDPIWIR